MNLQDRISQLESELSAAIKERDEWMDKSMKLAIQKDPDCSVKELAIGLLKKSRDQAIQRAEVSHSAFVEQVEQRNNLREHADRLAGLIEDGFKCESEDAWNAVVERAGETLTAYRAFRGDKGGEG